MHLHMFACLLYRKAWMVCVPATNKVHKTVLGTTNGGMRKAFAKALEMIENC